MHKISSPKASCIINVLLHNYAYCIKLAVTDYGYIVLYNLLNIALQYVYK